MARGLRPKGGGTPSGVGAARLGAVLADPAHEWLTADEVDRIGRASAAGRPEDVSDLWRFARYVMLAAWADYPPVGQPETRTVPREHWAGRIIRHIESTRRRAAVAELARLTGEPERDLRERYIIVR